MSFLSSGLRSPHFLWYSGGGGKTGNSGLDLQQLFTLLQFQELEEDRVYFHLILACWEEAPSETLTMACLSSVH